MFNEDTICMECKQEEKRNPKYKEAQDADIRESKGRVQQISCTLFLCLFVDKSKFFQYNYRCLVHYYSSIFERRKLIIFRGQHLYAYALGVFLFPKNERREFECGGINLISTVLNASVTTNLKKGEKNYE